MLRDCIQAEGWQSKVRALALVSGEVCFLRTPFIRQSLPKGSITVVCSSSKDANTVTGG